MEINIKPVDTILETAKGFIQKVIEPPLEQVGGLLADQVKSFRLQNQLNIVAKAEERLKKIGMRTKKVSVKQVAPFLEECGLEEDEDMQMKWAALLANTVVENSRITSNIFVSILKEMTKADAEVFEMIFDESTNAEEVDGKMIYSRNSIGIWPASFPEYPDIEIVFDNLVRLRVVRELNVRNGDQAPVIVSDLGIRFMEAVS